MVGLGRTNRAFTLIELLVVIAVIGILASLLLPALAKAKYTAQMAVCRNNLRQISVALHVYRTDHHAFPLHGSPDLNSAPPMWWKKLALPAPQFTQSTLGPAPFLMPRIGGVFACPLNQGASRPMQFGTAVETFPVRLPSIILYGYNAYGLGFFAKPLGVGGILSDVANPFSLHRETPDSAIRRPSDLIVVGDEFCRSRRASLDGHMPQGWGSPIISAVVNDVTLIKYPPKKQQPFLNHRGRANRAFADGHLEVEDMRKTFPATDAQLRRWNIDNEPHRELLTD